jgi:hypothetical protein
MFGFGCGRSARIWEGNSTTHEANLDIFVSRLDLLCREDTSTRPAAFVTVEITTGVDGDVVEDDAESEVGHFAGQDMARGCDAML